MDPIILIIIAIIIGSLGFLLGFITRMLTSGGSKSTKKSELPKVTKPKNRNWTEVAHLWRDDKDKRLIFQIDNQYYKRGEELTSRERKILLKVVMDFYLWLEPPNAKQISTHTSDVATIHRPDKSPAPELLSSKSGQDFVPEYSELTSPEIQPSVRPVGGILSTTISTPDTPSPTMVAQVDRILQEKLEAAGMQKWAVRLIESPNKGMIVMVGMERYEAIDDVPYKRVRDIIRLSVAEWEQHAENSSTT
jgi:hypothetical protein